MRYGTPCSFLDPPYKGAEQALESADADGFVVVSVKDDRATVYRTG